MTDVDSTPFLSALRHTAFSGDIRSDWAARIVWSTDNSIYQLIPDAVIFPKSTQDLITVGQLLSQSEFRNITISPRGGGTGTNGQSLNTGIILDTSRYMNQIIEINSKEQWVRVQPGVVLDSLNAALSPFDLVFVPNVAPSNRATIGGMISTDASGKGSRIYGKTSQHIMELSAVTVGGERLQLAKDHPSPIDALLHDISVTNRTEIDARFPKMPRFLSGYNLDHATRDGINPIPIIAGSEGTLVILAEAKLRVLPKPNATRLVIIQYTTITEAVAAAQDLLIYDPVAIETIDRAIIDVARTDICFTPLAEWVHPEVGALNLIELTDPSALLSEAFPPLSIRLAESATEATQWWTLRKKAVGLLANTPGRAKPVPFVEDTVVPPQYLSDYIRDFRALLDRHHLRYAMYGHADVGCVHVRPALDLQDPEHERLIRIISDEVHHLVMSYGGVIWGEHGKGFRSEYIHDVFGPILVRRMQEIKTKLDPHNQLNPGKLVPPLEITSSTKGIESPLRAHLDREIPRDVQDQFPEMMACNGNGACFTVMPSALMCPSYLATGDRIQSPKGRAMIYKEWLRQGKTDAFAEEVHTAMDGCLSCKACTSECPVHVNIPKLKSEFLDHYHTTHRRPLRDILIAHVETFSMISGKILPLRWISQIATHLPFIGLTDLPKLSTPLKKQRHRTPDIVIAVDAFTWNYAPEVAVAAAKVLEKMGYFPQFFPMNATGKPAYIKGYQRQFRTQATRLIDRLNALSPTPIVIIEPSISSMFADEYREITNLLPLVVPIAQFLETHHQKLPHGIHRAPIRLLSHCMELSGHRATQSAWINVLSHVGFAATLGDVGCCGMAGTFGHETEHAGQSKAIFDLSWRPTFKKDLPVAVTGFSCRHQVARCTGTPALHPLQLIANAL